MCRDFAVLGYCEKGIDCDKQHVRECPDFAESGTCPNPKCKLPHVIRANRNRARAAATAAADDAKNVAPNKAFETKQSTSGSAQISADDSLVSQHTQQGVDGNIGDEYISLTFHESGESDEDSESESGEDEENEEEQGDSDADGDEVEADPEEVQEADYS